MSEMSRHPTETRGQLREDRWTKHQRPRGNAYRPTEAVVRPSGTDRTGTADWQATADGNQLQTAVPLGRWFGLSYAEPHVQLAERWREPAHQPHHFAGFVARRFLVYIRRAEHRTPFSRYRPTHQSIEGAERHRQYRSHCGTRRRDYARCRLLD